MGSGGRAQPGKSSQRSSVSSVSSQAKLSQSSSNSHSLLRTHTHLKKNRHRSAGLREDPASSRALTGGSAFSASPHWSGCLTSRRALPPSPRRRHSRTCWRVRRTRSRWRTAEFVSDGRSVPAGCWEAAGSMKERRCQRSNPNRHLRSWEHALPASCYLVHVNDAIAVPLLSHVAEPSGDVDPAADVHVDLHGLLLDLTVQLRQVLHAGTQQPSWDGLKWGKTVHRRGFLCTHAVCLRCSSGLWREPALPSAAELWGPARPGSLRSPAGPGKKGPNMQETRQKVDLNNRGRTHLSLSWYFSTCVESEAENIFYSCIVIEVLKLWFPLDKAGNGQFILNSWSLKNIVED